MASNVRFADQLSVSAFGNIGGVNAVSSSYAETASFADFATSASYAVSASHEITKEVSSSHADTASFAQSGNGIFSGSFSGSYEGNGSGLTSIPASGIIGLPVVSGTTDTIPIFTSANGIGDSTITYNGESYIMTGIDGGGLFLDKTGGSRITVQPDDFNSNRLNITPSSLTSDSNSLTLEGSKFAVLKTGDNTATWGGASLDLLSVDDGNNLMSLQTSGEIIFTPDDGNGGTVTLVFPNGLVDYDYDLPTANGTVALLNNSGSGLFKATGSFTGSFIGDGSQLTGISHPTSSISSSYALTASYVETAQTASYVLNAVSSSYSTTSSYAFNAVSSSYALTASYAVSASHEIIHELSSSYAETASFAQSGNGIFSGSFSGSFEGNGSGLTDIPATGIIGLNLSQIASGSSTASISPNGGLFVNTNITASGNISASGFISASYFVGDGSQLINVVSSSYALTASYVETSQTASYVETAQTASYIISSSIDGITDYIRNDQTSSMTVLSSSFALTSSYVETAQTASYVLEAISSSFSSFAISASYAVSASHEIIKEVSSSYADTASFAQSGNGIFSGSFSGSFTGVSPTSSYALTASYVETAQTASYVETAQTAS